MKKGGDFMKKKKLLFGAAFLIGFVFWSFLITLIDVKPIGINNSNIGFASLNIAFHNFTGTNMLLYTVTDWAGLVPIAICFAFAFLGLYQLIKRRSLLKVDLDIIILGIYYIIVIACYLLFEMYPINYRPIFINGFAEASYPSSTTLLVLSVMLALDFQVKERVGSKVLKNTIICFSKAFSLFMVLGRLISGVHWLTDIIGSVLLSAGLFLTYKDTVLIFKKEK